MELFQAHSLLWHHFSGAHVRLPRHPYWSILKSMTDSSFISQLIIFKPLANSFTWVIPSGAFGSMIDFILFGYLSGSLLSYQGRSTCLYFLSCGWFEFSVQRWLVWAIWLPACQDASVFILGHISLFCVVEMIDFSLSFYGLLCWSQFWWFCWDKPLGEHGFWFLTILVPLTSQQIIMLRRW